jgi:hypothetical protein
MPQQCCAPSSMASVATSVAVLVKYLYDFSRSSCNVFVCPLLFIFGNQSVLEESESLRHAQDLPWSRLPTANCFTGPHTRGSKAKRQCQVRRQPLGMQLACMGREQLKGIKGGRTLAGLHTRGCMAKWQCQVRRQPPSMPRRGGARKLDRSKKHSGDDDEGEDWLA